MRLFINAIALSLFFGCGGDPELFPEPADGGTELGSAEQTITAPVAPGSGTVQIFGTSAGLSSCTTGQPANTACYVLRGDPLFSVNNQRWLGVKLGSGWHSASLPYVTPAFNQVFDDLPESSQGSSLDNPPVNFYSPASGDSPEILIDNVDLPGSGNSRWIPSFVKTIPQGNISGVLQEFPSPRNGDWRMFTRCVVQIDYSGIINQVIPALESAGESSPDLSGLLKQAIGKGILACIGVGNTNGPIVTNNTQYTHNSFTRNVYNGTRYFTRLERCMAHYGCAQGNCDDLDAVNFSQLNSGSLNNCGPD